MAHRDHRTHTYQVDKGSIRRAPGHRNECPNSRHAAARGVVQGLVDIEPKVSARFISRAKKRSSQLRGRPAAPWRPMAAISTLVRSSSGTKSTLRELLQDGPPWTWPVIAHGLRGVAGIGLRYEGQADATGRRGLRGKAHARIYNA